MNAKEPKSGKYKQQLTVSERLFSATVPWTTVDILKVVICQKTEKFNETRSLKINK